MPAPPVRLWWRPRPTCPPILLPFCPPKLSIPWPAHHLLAAPRCLALLCPGCPRPSYPPRSSIFRLHKPLPGFPPPLLPRGVETLPGLMRSFSSDPTAPVPSPFHGRPPGRPISPLPTPSHQCPPPPRCPVELQLCCHLVTIPLALTMGDANRRFDMERSGRAQQGGRGRQGQADRGGQSGAAVLARWEEVGGLGAERGGGGCLQAQAGAGGGSGSRAWVPAALAQMGMVGPGEGARGEAPGFHTAAEGPKTPASAEVGCRVAQGSPSAAEKGCPEASESAQSSSWRQAPFTGRPLRAGTCRSRPGVPSELVLSAQVLAAVGLVEDDNGVGVGDAALGGGLGGDAKAQGDVCVCGWEVSGLVGGWGQTAARADDMWRRDWWVGHGTAAAGNFTLPAGVSATLPSDP